MRKMNLNSQNMRNILFSKTHEIFLPLYVLYGVNPIVDIDDIYLARQILIDKKRKVITVKAQRIKRCRGGELLLLESPTIIYKLNMYLIYSAR